LLAGKSAKFQSEGHCRARRHVHECASLHHLSLANPLRATLSWPSLKPQSRGPSHPYREAYTSLAGVSREQESGIHFRGLAFVASAGAASPSPGSE
jgi:hypothetical protein